MRLALKTFMVVGLVIVACSQRVTPEEEFAREARDRPLVSESGLPPALSATGTQTQTQSASAAGDELRGEIVLPPDAGAAGDGVLFLFIRRADGEGGPPLAVQRHERVRFPFSFAIGRQNAMIAGVEFPDQLRVVARLDSDGNVMTEGPGDWRVASEPITLGSEGLELVLEPANP
jgi:hypothetical protein